jgi:hypothetical protein
MDTLSFDDDISSKKEGNLLFLILGSEKECLMSYLFKYFVPLFIETDLFFKSVIEVHCYDVLL